MFSDQRNCVNLMWHIVIGVLVIVPVYSFPRPENPTDQSQTTNLETLNSKPISVNVKNKIEKPVFNCTDANNIESENRVKNETSSDEARQLTIPFMAVPTNWLATNQPANAMFLTQKVPLRIWSIGSVAKFPIFLEKFVQRIQSYYSTYKYQDLSRPAPLAIINPQYHQYDPINGEHIDPIDHDTVEEEETEVDELDEDEETETPTIDYYDANTTELNYLNDDTELNEYGETESIST